MSAKFPMGGAGPHLARSLINVPALSVRAYPISTEIERAGSFDKLFKI